MTILNDGKALFLALVESALERTDYHAQYVARVVTQDSNGLLSVVPDNNRVPPMTEVPIRYGVPGVSAKVESGARVLIGFEGGDRRRPIATVWESAALTELRIISKAKVTVESPDVSISDGISAAAPVARVGDPIDVVFDATAVAAAVASGTGILVAVGVISAGATNVKAS